MYNLKDIRSNFDNFFKDIKKRNINIDENELIELDKKNRELIQKKEILEKEKKDLSKKKDKTLFEKSKKISEEISKISNDQNLIKQKLDDLLSKLPNLPMSDVPVGIDEKSNKELVKKGHIKKFTFAPKSHYEIGKFLNMLDFDLATKTSGSRFVFVKNQLAMLERALSNFMIDIHTKKKRIYRNFTPPNSYI